MEAGGIHFCRDRQGSGKLHGTLKQSVQGAREKSTGPKSRLSCYIMSLVLALSRDPLGVLIWEMLYNRQLM